MFRLYYFTYSKQPDMLFSNADLAPCLEFIRVNHLIPCQCVIVTPNSRKVTFNQNNVMMFSEFVAA